MRQILKTEKKVTRSRGSGEIRVYSKDLRKFMGKKVIVKIYAK